MGINETVFKTSVYVLVSMGLRVYHLEHSVFTVLGIPRVIMFF